MNESEIGCGCQETTTRIKTRSEAQKAALINRLSKIEGQVRGIKGMIEKDVYCDDVLHQLSAVQSALKSTAKLILESHMHSCVIERIKDGDEDVIDELLKTIGKMI